MQILNSSHPRNYETDYVMKLPASVLNNVRKTLLKARAPNLLLNARIRGNRIKVAI